MVTLPQLPTDKLYKLVTFGGLALLLGAFYMQFSKDISYEQTGNGTYTQIRFLTDHLVDVGLAPKPLPDNLTDENPIDRYAEYRDLIRNLPIDHPKREELRNKNEELLVRRLSNRQRIDLRANEINWVYFLFFSGCGFFLLGAVWWSLEERHRELIESQNALAAHYVKLLEHAPKRDTLAGLKSVKRINK